MAPLFADAICAIFNVSVRQGHVPNRWKLANVVPAPKVHPPKDAHSPNGCPTQWPATDFIDTNFGKLSWVPGVWSTLKTNLAETNLEH